MEKIRTTTHLKDAILKLEVKQQIDLEEMKEKVHITLESLKPVNLVKNTLKELSSSPYLVENLLTTSMALASGYFAKKVTVGSSESPFRKIMGTLLQFGVTNIVAKHAEEIKLVGQYIIQQFSKKEPLDSEEKDELIM